MPPQIPTNSTGDNLRDAVDTQMDLGWSNFMKGKISLHWFQAQAEYCRSFPTPKQFDSCT
eukprot:5789523-Ditylum_brightwellii.AAC.1